VVYSGVGVQTDALHCIGLLRFSLSSRGYLAPPHLSPCLSETQTENQPSKEARAFCHGQPQLTGG
jgi:hypothetical protein